AVRFGECPPAGLRPGLLLDFAKAHHLSRDARSTFAAEASTHPLGSASWNGLAREGTVGGMDADDEATWTYSRRVPAWARPFRGAPHAREDACHGIGLDSGQRRPE